MCVCVDAVENGGDGDIDDGDDSDGTTSCSSSDSGNSDSGETGDGLLCFVVKCSNALTVIETRRLCFLGITSFIAPKYSYSISVTSRPMVVSWPRVTFPTSG